MKALRIVFMGTPEFAVGILDAIIKQNIHTIVGVVTVADKPAGRGQKIKYSAVKEYALLNNLPLLQPISLKDDDFLNDLKAWNANLNVIVAFRMLPKLVWNLPELGTFNLHASLLPNYRGAAPINWAIINGETQTGVTTFFIDEKIDTGAIILAKNIAIEPIETAGSLHDKLMLLGCDAVLETLDLITIEKARTSIQPELPNIKTAYKLNKENCKIDFSKNINEIYNLVRGLSPYPSAWCDFKDGEQIWQVKIYEVVAEVQNHDLKIGTIITTKKELKIAVLNGFLIIESLQLPGKKRMTIREVLNGIKFSENAHAF